MKAKLGCQPIPQGAPRHSHIPELILSGENGLPFVAPVSHSLATCCPWHERQVACQMGSFSEDAGETISSQHSQHWGGVLEMRGSGQAPVVITALPTCGLGW